MSTKGQVTLETNEENGNRKSPGMIFYIPDTKQSDEDIALYQRIYKESSESQPLPHLPDIIEFPWRRGRMRVRVRFFAITGGIGFLLKGFPITFYEESEDAEKSLQHTHDFLDKRNSDDGILYPKAEFSFASERRRANILNKTIESNQAQIAEFQAWKDMEAQKAAKKATRDDLLDLPDGDDFTPRELHVRLKNAGIIVTRRAVEKRVAAATRPASVEGEQKDYSRLHADRSLAIEILTDLSRK